MKLSSRTLLAALSSAVLAAGFGAATAPAALAAPFMDEEISTIVTLQEDRGGGRGRHGERGATPRTPDERPGVEYRDRGGPGGPGGPGARGGGGNDGRGDGRGGGNWRDGRGGNDGRGDHWRNRGGNDGRGGGDSWRDNRGGGGNDSWRDNRTRDPRYGDRGRDPRYDNRHRPDPRFGNPGGRDWRDRRYTNPGYRNHTPPRYRHYSPPRYRNYNPPRYGNYYNPPRNNWRYHTRYYDHGYSRYNYRYYDAGCGTSGGEVFAGAILGALFGAAVADDDGAGALFGGIVGAGLASGLSSCDRGQYYYAASYSFNNSSPYYWYNPHSGVRGVVIARDYYNYGGRRCRWGDAEIFMPNGDYVTDRILMCQDRWGRWEVARHQ
ncbi:MULTISPECIES: hypothetical protein [Hyphobacterium]|uniref:Glycine zipper domain-containing protein n=1 Tax=Hyphobacterium vulgare TaxID=1736751 RepID=A0ABV6ZUZ2_9PROT